MATNAMGTKLMIGGNYIAELTEISGLEISADTLETTTLETPNNYRTFVQGLKDAGEVSVSGYFNPGDTNGQLALVNLFGTGALTAFSVIFPASMGASWSFSGIVTGVTTGASNEDLISFEATIKVSGAPSLGTTPSANLSALSLTGTGGSLSPAFNGGNYKYTFSGVTAASITVNASLAGATLRLFVDDLYVQDLTSGSASSAIALTLNVGKKINIIAQESGETPKIYEIIAVKTA